MADSQLLTIVLIASVAGFFLVRLYLVLGRRTGHERPPRQDFSLAPRQAEDALAAPVKAGPALAAPERPSDPVASGLYDIAEADRGFDKDQFLKGAKAAYEMILAAYAAADRAALKPLISDEVFAAFDAVMTRREQQKQKVSITLVGFSEVKIIAASLKAPLAEITLAFGARLISFTADAEGKTVEGDISVVQNVTDLWTFSRDVRLRDPNWVLIATSSEPN